VTAVPAFLLSKIIGKNLESLQIIGTSLLAGGVVMWAVDAGFTRPRTERVEDMRLGQAAWIGAVQVLSAVFPGTSRSMSTIAGGQVAGLSRSAALEFSFLVSIPTMAAATGYDLLKSALRGSGVAMGAHEWGVLLLGLSVSFVVALGVIAWFMGWVRRRGFVPFAAYRIALGCAVIVWAVTTSAV
jgi:undecaprenyl-diphosphatase